MRRNDRITLQEIEVLDPDHLVLSPGPCTPDEAGVSVDAVRRFSGRLPILGVCLGHQSIAQAYGGRIVRAPKPVHGKTSSIAHDGESIFNRLPNPFTATRYHSLIVEKETLPGSDRAIGGRPDHGVEAWFPARLRRTVSPGVHLDRSRQTAVAEFRGVEGV